MSQTRSHTAERRPAAILKDDLHFYFHSRQVNSSQAADGVRQLPRQVEVFLFAVRQLRFTNPEAHFVQISLFFAFVFQTRPSTNMRTLALRNPPHRPSRLDAAPMFLQRRVLTAATARLLCTTGSGWA